MDGQRDDALIMDGWMARWKYGLMGYIHIQL